MCVEKGDLFSLLLAVIHNALSFISSQFIKMAALSGFARFKTISSYVSKLTTLNSLYSVCNIKLLHSLQTLYLLIYNKIIDTTCGFHPNKICFKGCKLRCWIMLISYTWQLQNKRKGLLQSQVSLSATKGSYLTTFK